MCVRDIEFTYFYDFSIEYQNCSDRVIYIFFILFTAQERVRLKSLIDVLFCKLHYGFGGNRLSTLSKQVSFWEFIFDRYDVSV